MTDKAPSKTAQLKAERAERKAAREAKRVRELQAMADLKDRAQRLCQRMPPQYQEWGVTKTRAYTKMMAIVKHKAGLKTIKSERLAKYITTLETSDAWTLDYCQALSQLPETAADISCQ